MSTSTRARSAVPAPVWIALCVIGGLLLGLILSLVVARGSEPKYSATTNYALLPGTKISAENMAQVAFLTPVFAAQANDPTTKAEVKTSLGGKPLAETVVQTYPDSQLIFTLTATGTDPQNVIDTLRGFEKVLVQKATAGEPVETTQARLRVIAAAEKPTTPTSMSNKVVYLGGALAGAMVGLALALGLQRRRLAAAARAENRGEDRVA